MPKNKIRLIVWTIVTVLIIMIPLLMLFTDEINWVEAAAYCFILLAVGGACELARALHKRSRVYRWAAGIGLVGAFLLFWANGAVGIIGSEDNPANLMYGAVFLAGLIGSLLSRLKPRGMAITLFTAAVIQMLVPVFALLVWPAQASWGQAGVIGVFMINVFFALLFVVSSLLFRRASIQPIK